MALEKKELPDKIPEDIKDEMYKLYLRMMARKKEMELPKRLVEEKDEKYQAMIKFMNRMMRGMGRPEIKKLEEFKDIDRMDILKIQDEMLESEEIYRIYKIFKRRTLGWYQRKQTDTYILTIMRKTCEQMGYKFKYRQQSKAKNCIEKIHSFYYIL